MNAARHAFAGTGAAGGFIARRYATADHISQLDPRRDAEAIARLMVTCEFPFDAQKAMELAFFRTFGIPAIARVLVGTGKFVDHTGQRVADTHRLLHGLVLDGYSSPAGRRLLDGIRHAHRGLPCDTDEMRYVLGTFVFEPIRWVERFGWRPLLDGERRAAFRFWRGVGGGLGINVPDDPARFEAFYDDFEARRMVPDPANRELAQAAQGFFVGPLPAPLRPIARDMMNGLLDPRLRHACGLPEPSPWAARLAPALLRARSRAAAVLMRGRAPVV